MMKPIDLVLSKLPNVTPNGTGWNARCPCQDHGQRRGDLHPSLHIAETPEGKVLVKCVAGCATESVLREIGLKMADLFPPVNDDTVLHPPSESAGGLTLKALAGVKRLPEDFLKGLGCRNTRRNNLSAVAIPFPDVNGMEKAVHYRLRHHDGDHGEPRFVWRKGDKTLLYGLNRLATIRKAGWVLLVEGESDCWTAWFHGIPALGLPGKMNWQRGWAAHFQGLDLYVWIEPDAEDLIGRLGKDLPGLKVIRAPEGMKDLSEAHLQGRDLPSLLGELKAAAVSVESLREADQGETLADLQRRAGPVLTSPDPIERVWEAIEGQGYGGKQDAPRITYLAATSRLLKMRTGSMPVHLLLCGQASSGKSYALRTALNLLPEEAYHTIDAGSPRVMIYDNAPLSHRVLVFGEADSLPAGEDNPAASAIRNLLQDHYLHYSVVIRDPDTGDFTVREITKPGPTVLITTSTRRLGHQLDTRLFSLELPDDPEQLRAALTAQADLEREEGAAVPDTLLAYQSLLQAQAPWNVWVPFAKELARRIGQSPANSRITRDYSRLLSLIKSATVLREVLRSRDALGRLIATLEDYATVYELVAELYRETATGAGQRVRETVQAVQALRAEGTPIVSVTDVGNRLQVPKMSASRRIRAALKGGWLINKETRKGHPYDLDIGEPLPPEAGLPAPSELDCNTVTPPTVGDNEGVFSEPDLDQEGEPIPNGKTCYGVTPPDEEPMDNEEDDQGWEDQDE